MKKASINKDHLLSLANFIAAFGGGTILGKAIKVLDNPYLHDGSILAFFVGITFGLMFLQIIPKSSAKLFSRWFSIGGGMTSIILLLIFKEHAYNNVLSGISAVVFFLFLSLRFGLWFFSRAIRASSVARQNQSIAWVELGYYSGMILGLILWKCTGIDINLATALIIDASLQFAAGMMDLRGYKLATPTPEITNALNENISFAKSYSSKLGIKLGLAVIFLTVGIQVIILSLTHQFSEYLSSWIIATFYFGAAIAAYVSKKLKIQLKWINTRNKSTCGTLYFGNGVNIYKISSINIGILSALSVGATILITTNHLEIWLLVFTFLSAFFYEILALALLDKIGHEEQLSNRPGMLIRTYGLMGTSAAVGLWVIGLMNSSSNGLILTLLTCIACTLLTIRVVSAEQPQN